ncbi:rare lipoprotein A [Cruoricaptor ignavus]|uniref:Probable endolytic peptidoglycan transglycosylase RlpA n=1 Tax=Cruoricaptor ignavus TaxID=1118202 RepID=A0A1M5ZYH6_9FLAO|nr:septal ring lytic transglycosylase RlpA family protein [Cruoricaptor ignavus]SHI29290.1 rare lipoprotein A [Cruoricaptor ignavus]
MIKRFLLTVMMVLSTLTLSSFQNYADNEKQTTIASYYGNSHHGKPTASGKKFSNYELTAAHKTLPFGTKVRVTNPKNGKSVVVTITDRGPFIKGRQLDLSQKAFSEIGNLKSGIMKVEYEVI